MDTSKGGKMETITEQKTETVTEQTKKINEVVLNIVNNTALTKFKNSEKRYKALKEFMNSDVLVINKDLSVIPKHDILTDMKLISNTIKDDGLKVVFEQSRQNTAKTLYKEHIKNEKTTA